MPFKLTWWGYNLVYKMTKSVNVMVIHCCIDYDRLQPLQLITGNFLLSDEKS